MLKFSATQKPVLDGIVLEKRLANAYVFSGSQFAFVDEAAWYFSQALHCTDFSANGPCNACEPCLKLKSDTFTDALVLDVEKKINIDQIRDIQERVKYGPAQSRFLTVIVPKADQMGIEAANAFLKTLEEPPKGVVFILLCPESTRLLSTIRSRCQCFSFPALSTDDLLAVLSTDYSEELQQLSVPAQSVSPTVLGHFMESGDWNLDVFCDYDSFKGMDMVSRMSLCEKLSKDKPLLARQLALWIETLLGQPDSLSYDDLDSLKLMIEIISQLQYNLNHRLHLDRMAVNV